MAFIGRDAELIRLATALQRAAEGTASRVVIRGPTGIGISGLLDELESRLGDVKGVVVARATAYESCAEVPYFCLGRALGAALGGCRDRDLARIVGTSGHDLAALLPGFGERLRGLRISTAEPKLVAPDQRGSRLAEAIIGALDRLGRDGVVLLVLEDLHWADPGTRSFIEGLLRITRRLSLCLVMTYDPEEFHRRHPARPLALALEASPLVEVLTIPPLDRDELSRFAEGITGEQPSGSLLAALIEGSQGNPLLASQLLAAQASVEGLRLSESYEATMHARLSALPAPAVRCLQVLAAARRPMPRLALLGMALPDGRLTAAGLAEAVTSGLAAESRDHDGADRVGIHHPLSTEAIERLISPPERQQIHRALAQTLAEGPSERSWHWEAAMDFAEARDAHLAAGREAEALDPGGTALVHYERCLELSGDPASIASGSPSGSAELLERAAGAAFSAGAFRRAASLAQQAIAIRSSRAYVANASAGGRGKARELQLRVGALYERLGRYRWSAGDLKPALEAFEKALELIPDEPIPERARALASLAQHLMIDGRFDDSARAAERAQQLARAAGRDALAELGHATCTLGVDIAYDGELERGLRLLEEATGIARQAGRLDDLMRAYANRTTLLDLDSRRNDALRVVQEGLEEARRGGLEGVYGAFLRGNAADILYMLGRWTESEAECRAALEWSPAGVAWFTPTLSLALLLAESRADEEASRLVGQALLQLETVPAGQWTATIQRAAVSLALWRGDLVDAQQVAAREWQRVIETDDPLQIARAASTTLEACAAAAEAARARRDYATIAASGELSAGVLPAAEESVAASDLPPTLGIRREAELHLDTARAHEGRRLGHPDPLAFGRIAAAWTARSVPYLAATARWWEAVAALQARDRNQRSRAREALVEAWQLAASLPARPLMRELSGLARRARIVLPAVEGVEAAELLAGVEEAAGVIAGQTPLAAGEGERLTPGGTGDGHAAVVALTSSGGRAPFGPGPRDGDGLDGTRDPGISSLDEMGIDAIIALASTPTGRAIGERLVAQEQGERRDPFGLSPREAEVLNVLVEGRTNREIASRLFISERTVGVHVRKILAKLGVAGRVEAASLAIRLGLVPEAPSDYTARRR